MTLQVIEQQSQVNFNRDTKQPNTETVYTVSLSPNQVVDQPVLPENENSYGTGFCKLDRYSKVFLPHSGIQVNEIKKTKPAQLTCSIQHNVDEVLNVTINRGQRGRTGAALYVFPVYSFSYYLERNSHIY